jgi:hypothetical protein
MLRHSCVDLGARRRWIACQCALRIGKVLFDPLYEQRGIIAPRIARLSAARQSAERD